MKPLFLALPLLVVFFFVSVSPVTAAPKSAFHVTGVTVDISPSNVSIWPCGANIQVVYHAVFHIAPGSPGVFANVITG